MNEWTRDQNIGGQCDSLARLLCAADPPASVDPDSPLADVWRAARDRAAVALSLLSGIEYGENSAYAPAWTRYSDADALMDLDGIESQPDGLIDALRSMILDR